MSQAIYKKVFLQVNELLKLDKKVSGLAVEALGGETTLMPFEWWQDMLPFTMEMLEHLPADTGKTYPGELVFITNNTSPDKRYIDLLNSYADNPLLEVFTSWEPDTGRHDLPVMAQRYHDNGRQITSSQFCLSVIPTKAVIALGAENIILGPVNDIGANLMNVDMLYPYGSGKQFFGKNQPPYIDVANFYIDLDSVSKRDGQKVLIPLIDEVRESLSEDKPFCNMGNDSYNIDIDPDGTTSMNSTQTGTESEAGDIELHIDDPLWPVKFIFENTPVYEVKVNGRHEYCFQCEFLTYCSGGYYEHKSLSATKIKELSINGGCPGFKQLWMSQSHLKIDRTASNHRGRLEVIARASRTSNNERVKKTTLLLESKWSDDAAGYFSIIKQADEVTLAPGNFLGKSVTQRLWFYDALGIKCVINTDGLSETELSLIVENIVFNNYQFVALDSNIVRFFLSRYPHCKLANMILGGVTALFSEHKIIESDKPTILASGLVVDSRNDELFSWLLANFTEIAKATLPCELSPQSKLWIEVKKANHKKECFLRDLKNKLSA
jgi:hypothetical protein